MTVNYEVIKEENDKLYSVRFKIPNKNSNLYSYEFTLHRWPTSNCQVFNIAPLNSLINYYSIDKLQSVLSELKENYGLPDLLLFDIKCSDHEKLIEVFGSSHVESEYTSTNGSQMILGLVNIQNLKNKK